MILNYAIISVRNLIHFDTMFNSDCLHPQTNPHSSSKKKRLLGMLACLKTSKHLMIIWSYVFLLIPSQKQWKMDLFHPIMLFGYEASLLWVVNIPNKSASIITPHNNQSTFSNKSGSRRFVDKMVALFDYPMDSSLPSPDRTHVHSAKDWSNQMPRPHAWSFVLSVRRDAIILFSAEMNLMQTKSY